jgi:membrane-bound serine protease (ClpP class)
MKTGARIPSLIGLFLLLLSAVAPVAAQTGGRTAFWMTAEGPLTPAMASYIQRGLERAAAQGADLVVLQLDTPGGSTDLMEDIVQDLLDSAVPVVVYVAPRGAMAGSAGVLITLAGHLAAMAPETAIGAASPVGGQGEDIGETMETKVKQIMMASARSMTERRGPEASALAEEMIDKARAVSAREALDAGLIDYIATSREDLLSQLDGAQVTVRGEPVQVQTTGIVIQEFGQTLVETVLQFLTNPNIVFLLLTIGIQAILIEFASPGGWVAGFTGAVAVLLAVYGLGILPVNWIGAIFIVIAFILFAVDLKAPTHGALTAAGLGSFIAGALILFNSATLPGFPRVSVPLVVGTGLAIALSFSVIIGFAIRAMRVPVKMDQQSLVGRTGFARTPLNPSGTVFLAGELWTAELSEPGQSLPSGVPVEVVSVTGVRLVVRPAQPNRPASAG